MPEPSFRVNAVTVGTSSRKFEHLSGGYVYGGSKHDSDEASVSASPREYSAARKQQRKEACKALIKAHPEWSIPRIAGEMGLADKTVRGYARELDPAKYRAADQAAVKREKMTRFTAALAADPDPSRPNVAAAARAAGITVSTGYSYWKELKEQRAREGRP